MVVMSDGNDNSGGIDLATPLGGIPLAASLALPLAAATTTSAVTGLIVMHLTVGAVVIPAMAHTARAR